MKNLLLSKVKLILNQVTYSDKAMTINELSKQLDIPLPTVSRITADLIEMGLLEKTDYHSIAPASGMIALAEAAAINSPLPRCAAPQIRQLAAYCGLNGMLAAFDGKHFFRLFSCGKTEFSRQTIWDTGAAAVLLGSAQLTKDEAADFFIKAKPESTDTEKQLFERDFEISLEQGTLFRINTMRNWSFSLPFRYKDLYCALCLFGHAPGNLTPEAFAAECRRTVSRIKKSL